MTSPPKNTKKSRPFLKVGLKGLLNKVLVRRRLILGLWLLAIVGGWYAAMAAGHFVWDKDKYVGPKPLAWMAPILKWLFQNQGNEEFASIAGGTFVMGDLLDNIRDARPHEVELSPYMIGRHEVTQDLWEKVLRWGLEHGYTDLASSGGKEGSHPVCAITWNDAVKWCNARSEMEGLTPCYYETTEKTSVFRVGTAELTNRSVKWEANGYRLPTEAEWEMAARGGLKGRRFPWGDDISHDQANYSGSKEMTFDKSLRDGPPKEFAISLPYTAPVGRFGPNGYGVYDLSGNVWEWCWDFYDKNYGLKHLEKDSASIMALLSMQGSQKVKDPHGPEFGTTTVIRGGSWRHSAADARCASRYDMPAAGPALHVGLRLVRSN